MTQSETSRTNLRIAAVAGVAMLTLATPVAAEYTRYCNGTLTLTPQNPSMTYLQYDFSVGKTVHYFAQVNEARRDSRARMLSCVRSHWSMPEATARPDDCLGIRDYHLRGYPFDSLETEVADALCAANPDADTIVIRVDLTITGDTGCVMSGTRDTITILRNFSLHCAAPIGDGGADEAHDAEPGPIGDAGDWDCVGEGCDGADEAEPAPPPTASYQFLPLIRLPGNDLYMLGASDGIGDWMDCRQACTEDTRCGAWTYRAPTNRCLIKSRAGIPIPDGCCRSGIKR